MTRLTELVLATHNAHKLEEVRSILSPLHIQVIGGDEVKLKDIEETGKNFHENALLKAQAAFQQIQKPVLADDSGICITALNGSPGLYSARFATEYGGYPAVFNEVWKRIGNNPDRSAYFNCTMALVLSETEYHIFEGRMTGHIASEARGKHLFGYDPIFIPDGYTETCGELDSSVKNRISHRAHALKKLINFLKSNYL